MTSFKRPTPRGQYGNHFLPGRVEGPSTHHHSGPRRVDTGGGSIVYVREGESLTQHGEAMKSLITDKYYSAGGD